VKEAAYFAEEVDVDFMFFLVSIVAFNGMALGNGTVMLSLVRKTFVEDHPLLSADQLVYAFAISQVAPGQANLYVASIGYLAYGPLAGLIAILAINVPGALMIPVMRWYQRVHDIGAVRRFIAGLTSAAVGLIFASLVDIARQALTQPPCWVVFLATLAFTQILRWNALVSLLAASALGMLLMACL
jgi:chromate transporter